MQVRALEPPAHKNTITAPPLTSPTTPATLAHLLFAGRDFFPQHFSVEEPQFHRGDVSDVGTV